MLPPLTDANRAFWTGGASGELLIQFCAVCDRWIHPPTTACSACSGPVEARPVAGTGRLFTYTIAQHQFHPDVPVPYVIAIVVLDEQDDLRLETNIVNCEFDALACDMPVRVLFEPHGDVYVPLFEPA
jgi:uncharacterized OB-fold protein